MSPYSICAHDTPPRDGTRTLPEVLSNQLKWMTGQKGAMTEADISAEIVQCMLDMRDVHALDALKSFVHCDQHVVHLLEKLSDLSTWLVGTWKGLEHGRDFGWIKKLGGGRAQRVWCHRNAVEHIEGLAAEDMLQFRVHTDEKGMKSAIDVKTMHDDTESGAETLLGCTHGGEDAFLRQFVPPRLLLMTGEELGVLKDFNMETQRKMSEGDEDCGFVEKIFRVPAPTRAACPTVEELFAGPAFTHTEAQKELDDLIAVKSELKMTDIQVWKEHTKKTVLTAQIVPELRRRIGAEMCTNAFAKMYELLSSFNLIPHAAEHFNSLHLCEGPGAFVCATNHYIRQHQPSLEWNWRACTLNPHFEANASDEMIEDDTFINETWERWDFGADNSGDLTSTDNIRSAWEAARAMGPVLLVTADGSVDCSSNPAAQEQLVAPLHLCETTCALGALARGGSFVLKMFTLLAHSSFGLLHLLARLFEEVQVCKPVMSTPGNSETYLVCLRFCGVQAAVLDALLQHAGKRWPSVHAGSDAALFPRAVMEEGQWLDEVVRGARFFARMQAAVIRRNLKLFQSMTASDRGAIASARKRVAGEWTRRVGIRRIDERCRVVPGRRLTGEGERARVGAPRKRRSAGDLNRRRAAEERRQRIRRDSRQDLTDAEGAAVVQKSEEVEADASFPCRAEGWQQDDGPGEREGEPDSRGSASDTSSRVDDERGPHPKAVASRHSSGPGQGENRDGSATGGDSWGGSLDWVRASTGEDVMGEGRAQLASWIVCGVRAAEYTQSKACSEELLLELLAARHQLRRAAERPAASQRPAATTFVSRAGLKMMEIEAACSPTHKGASVFDLRPDMLVVDLYGGRGGCSDFLTWRLQHRITSAWVLHRADKPPPTPLEFRSAANANAQATANCKVCLAADGRPLQADLPEQYRELLRGALAGARGACAVVVGDAVLHAPTAARSREPGSSSCALAQCWAALSLLRGGGALLLRIEDALGRCTLGLLFLLRACFARMAICKPASSSASKGERFLVCLGFAGPSADHVLSTLHHVESAMDLSQNMAAGASKGVVEIVPVRLLQHSGLLAQLTRINEQHARTQIAAIREHLEALDRTRKADEREDS